MTVYLLATYNIYLLVMVMVMVMVEVIGWGWLGVTSCGQALCRGSVFW